MQTVCEHADFAIGGRDKFAVKPDQIWPLIKGHRHNCLPEAWMARSVPEL
jgi:hypothetical protein